MGSLGRYGIALRELDEIVQLAPDAPAYLRVAQARQLLGRPAAAVGAG